MEKSSYLVAAARGIGAEAPSEIVLIEPGEMVYTNQSPPARVQHTPEKLKMVAANFKKLNKEVVFDYEHQTLSGDQAPAAGWINDLFYDPARGLVAKLKEWTEKAQNYIENKEYRFYSPVIALNYKDSKTGENIGPVLHSVGLTNDPLMYWLEPLTAKAGKEKDMDKLKLIAKLGLAPNATDEEIDTALDGLLAAKDRMASTDVLELLGAKSDSKLEDIKILVAKLKQPPTASKPDPSLYVAKSDFDSLQTDFTTLKEERDNEKAEKTVTDALQAGKLTMPQKDWALQYAKSDPQGFAGFIANAPKVVPTGEKKFPAGAAVDKENLIAKYISENKCDYKTAALAVAKNNPELFK